MSYISYHHIDWLSYTTPMLYTELLTGDFEVLEWGHMGYNRTAVEENSGLRIYWSTDNDRMKTHVVYNGDCLQWYRSQGLMDESMVEGAISQGKVRRIDIAITSHPDSVCASHELTPRKQLDMELSGQLKSRLQGGKEISFKGAMETYYLGASRDRLYRGYDKGIQMGFVRNWLQRFELQSGDDGAETVARAVAQGQNMGEIMNKYVKFQHGAWDEIVAKKTARLTHAPEIAEPDTRKWLNDVASHALANYAIASDNPEAVLAWFFNVTKHHMSEMLKKLDNPRNGLMLESKATSIDHH